MPCSTSPHRSNYHKHRWSAVCGVVLKGTPQGSPDKRPMDVVVCWIHCLVMSGTFFIESECDTCLQLYQQWVVNPPRCYTQTWYFPQFYEILWFILPWAIHTVLNTDSTDFRTQLTQLFYILVLSIELYIFNLFFDTNTNVQTLELEVRSFSEFIDVPF